MHFPLRVRLAMACLIWADVSPRAQTSELPPIFASPSAAPAAFAPSANSEQGQSSHLSARVRLLVNNASQRILADAKPFGTTAPTPSSASELDSSTPLPSTGVVMLPRYVVRSFTLRRAEVERGDLPPLRPYVVERDGRPGIITGYTFPLWRSSGGTRELNLNLMDFAGRGADHAKDFGRVELEFKIRF